MAGLISALLPLSVPARAMVAVHRSSSPPYGPRWIPRCKARASGNLVQVVVFVSPACAEFWRRAGRNQKAGEIRLRGRFVCGQPLASKFVARAWADEVDLERVDEVLADVKGGGRRRRGGVGFAHAA